MGESLKKNVLVQVISSILAAGGVLIMALDLYDRWGWRPGWMAALIVFALLACMWTVTVRLTRIEDAVSKTAASGDERELLQRIQDLENADKKLPPVPSVVAFGVRWSASNVGGPNEPNCERCFQQLQRLVPLMTSGDDEDEDVYVWCKDPSHGEWHQHIPGESWRHGRRKLRIEPKT